MNNDELLARLRAADPARVSDAPQPDLDRLLEAITVINGTEIRPTADIAARRRRRWLPAAAACVLLTVSGGVLAVAASRGNDGSPQADGPKAAATSTPSAGTGVLKLTVPGEANGRCAPVGVESLRHTQTAFEGTATSVRGDLVTLDVDHWYRGGDAGTVEVLADKDAVTLLLGVEFKAGGHYLVAANDGQVTTCGQSAEASPHLRGLYEQAFTPRR